MKNPLFIVGVLIICLMVSVSVLFYQQRQQELGKTVSLRKEMETLSAERITIQKSIKDTNEEKQKLQQEIEERNEKSQALRSDISKTNAAKEDLLKEISEKERLYLSLNDRLNSIVAQETELNSQLEKAKADYQKTTQQMETARREKAALEEHIKARISPPKGVELKKIVVKLAPPVEGRVLEVNKEYNFGIINLGLKDNIKEKDIFGVYRKGQLIGKAVAEKIYDDMSGITVLEEWSDVSIIAGDTVKLLKP